MTVTKCQNFEFVTLVTRSGFCILIFKIKIKSVFQANMRDLVTFWSQILKIITNWNVTCSNLLLFLFRLRWFGMNKIRQNKLKSEPCFYLLFGIRLGTALRRKSHINKSNQHTNGTVRKIKDNDSVAENLPCPTDQLSQSMPRPSANLEE